MFKLHRHKSDKLGDKLEFRFTHLQAIKIPRGCDKLVLSIISVETGKVVAKSNKATVRSGTCQWTEAESILLSQDESSKELEESQFKIVISMGSARSGILGEVTLNLKDHLNSGDSGPLLLPLSYCESGTTLQVKIQCLAAKSKFRIGKSRRDDPNPNIDDTDRKTDFSDNILSRESNLSNRFVSTHSDEFGNRDATLSTSGSHRSSDSGDSSFRRTTFSPKNSSNAAVSVGRQDSTGSYVSATYGAGPVEELSKSNRSSFNSRASGSSFHTNQWQDSSIQVSASGLASPALGQANSPKDLMEAAEEIEELRDEVQMWERHSRQLKIDIELLKKEISEKSKHQANLDKDLSAAYGERDNLKQEVERLQLALNESITKETHANSTKHEQNVHLLDEMESEVKFQKESNANLMLQLKKSQESNIELLTIVQELEVTVEKQALEITNLSQKDSGFENGKNMDNENLLGKTKWESKLGIANGSHSDLLKEIETLKFKVQDLERDCAELTDENLDLLFKMKTLSKEKDFHGPHSFDFQFSVSHDDSESEATVLEKQRNEFKWLEKKEVSNEPSSAKFKNLEKLYCDLEFDLKHFKDEATDLQIKLQKTQVELEEKNIELLELKKKLGSIKDIGITQVHDGTEATLEELKPVLLLKEQEIDDLISSKKELEELTSDLRKEKNQLQEDLDALHRENIITTKCLEDVQHDLMLLTNNLDSQVSANKVLERKLMEVEGCRNELELQISDLEQENVQSSERISGLEAQLRYLTNDKESSRLELEDSKSLTMNLKDQLEKLKAEMDMKKTDLKQKLQEAQKQMSEAQEESDILKRSNTKLQNTIESLIEECSALQRLSGDLKRQKIEMHERVTQLEIELDLSKNKSLGLHKQIDLLETKLSSMQKDIASKEKSLLSQLEIIFQEHKEHEEKITKANLMLKRMELEKNITIENLEREIAQLMTQMSSTHEEREKVASNAVHEVSILCSEKAKLEFSLSEANAKIQAHETDIETMRQESKDKIQGLVDLLNASKQSEEMLMADMQHMQRLLEDVKSGEEKSRNLANELESKLKACYYEKQQITDESSDLKFQLQKLSHLQDEISTLKVSLDEAKFEKGKLEGLLKSTSEEFEEVKLERDSLMEEVSNIKKAIGNREDEKRNRIALQERLLRLESDLSAKDASYVYEAELRNELNRFKRSNSEYQRKLHSLEQEKDEFVKKAELMEKKLMQTKETNHYINVKEDYTKLFGENGKLHSINVDGESKIHLLERKLAEALEANNIYKQQLEKFKTEKQADNPQVFKKLPTDGSTGVPGTSRMSSLEAELKEMKERYLNMSLQYAEVEAQREQLVMQLKSVKKDKKWFS